MTKNYLIFLFVVVSSFHVNNLFAGGPPPPADNCANTVSLVAAGSPFSNTTVGAANDFNFCTMGSAADKIYYYDLPVGSTLTIQQTTNGYDSRHSMRYSGACPGTIELVCRDDPDTQVESWQNCTGILQRVYWIQSGYLANEGTYTITWSVTAGTCPVPPANDDCPNATALPVNPTAACASFGSGLTTAATSSMAGCVGTANDDVWFSFVALATSHDVTLSNATGTTDLVHEVFSGTCGSLTSLGCSDPNTSSYTGLTVGATYYVRVYTFASNGNNTGFDICITSPCGVGSTQPTCGLNYTMSSIAHAPYNYNQGTSLTFTDDKFADNYSSIGFDFCFDGIIYTDVLVSSNGYLIFPSCYSTAPGGTVTPGGTSPWDITAAIPNTTNAPTNAIMLWHDIDPSVAGTIRTRVEGTAPNRVFVAKFDDVAMYSCTSLRFSAQIMLYETTGDIEIHVTQKVVCATWNDGDAILGLHNFDGTTAVTNAAHNYPTDWTESNTAYRFTNNCGPCTVLPVELIDFVGISNPGYNTLSWKTASEINNAYFVLERSNGGPHFEEVAIIPGGGNSNSMLEYTYTHIDPREVEYYRLKQVDFDGKYGYSKIISVRSNKELDVSAYPNPVKNELNLDFLAEKDDIITVIVSDILGNTFSKQVPITKGNTNMKLNEFQNLSAGLYSVKVVDKNNTILFVKKIVKD